MDIKTKNDNGICYKRLEGVQIGDVFEYVSDRGITRHYVVSFLYKSMGISFANIIFPDGFSEIYRIDIIKNDKKIMTLPDWSFIKIRFKEEANMYD